MSADAAAEQARRIFMSAALLGATVLGGLAVGAAVGLEGGARSVALPALALQTFLTVGGIPRRRGSEAMREGLILVLLHYTVATLPLVAVALLIGLDEPLGFGFFLVAIAPPGALIPAFAARLEVDVRSVLVFCLAAYSIALVLTPAVLLLVAGTTVGVAGIATTMGAGLIAPSVLGRLVHERIVRVPLRVRRGIVNTTIFLICLGLGGELVDGLRQADVGAAGLVLVALVLTLRTFGSGWINGLLAPRGLSIEAALAGGFKNVALAATVGGALLGPVAAVPGLLAFFVDTAYFLYLARKRSAGVRAG
jgi:BASS family bile acid:Na+ symporter